MPAASVLWRSSRSGSASKAMPRPGSFYRGEQRSLWGLTLAVTLAVILVLFLVFLFYWLQDFIVYEKDGLKLSLPGEQEEQSNARPVTAASRRELPLLADVEIVVDKTDYSSVVTTAGTDVPTVHARYIPASSVTSGTLDGCVASMGDYDGLVLEIKPGSGVLSYASRVPLTNSYGVNGTLDLKSYAERLKEKNVYLIAEMSCLVDVAMGVRNNAIALKSATTGGIYTSDGLTWLDPYSDQTRAYLSALIDELADMGFDEVILSGLWCPNSDALQFSASMTVTPDSESAVSSLSLYLRQRAEEDGIRLSALAESMTLRSGGAGTFGQDLPVFFRMFDRVAFEADASTYDIDLSALQAALGVQNEPRIFPIATGFVPQRSAYALH